MISAESPDSLLLRFLLTREDFFANTLPGFTGVVCYSLQSLEENVFGPLSASLMVLLDRRIPVLFSFPLSTLL